MRAGVLLEDCLSKSKFACSTFLSQGVIGTSTCFRSADGSFKCWGRNEWGRLGLGDVTNRGDQADQLGANLPAVDLAAPALAIAVGMSHSCALLEAGRAFLPAVDLDGRAVQISLGWDHACALLEHGAADLPAVDLGGGRAVAIATGGYHSCALLVDGSLKCWGFNNDGQLGQGHTTFLGDGASEMGASARPPLAREANLPAVDLDGTAVALSLGAYHSCALLAKLAAVDLDGRAVAITAGLHHTCALLAKLPAVDLNETSVGSCFAQKVLDFDFLLCPDGLACICGLGEYFDAAAGAMSVTECNNCLPNHGVYPNCICGSGTYLDGTDSCVTCPVASGVDKLATYSPPEAFFSSSVSVASAISFGQQPNGCWAANEQDIHQWLAMDTGSVQGVRGVATQGRGDSEQMWVTSYKVSVSNDAGSWTPVDAGVTFTGNVGVGDAVVRNDFAATVYARYVRIEPVTWHSLIAMRAGVYLEYNLSSSSGSLSVADCVDPLAVDVCTAGLACVCGAGEYYDPTGETVKGGA
ncbi:regulator of chromosome condensation 1/beta-lactamase-inhibitor protein II [Baffinella frigidus]|nr:regulator of chromosome condensation 1/beta-lactamase-inhibitor protein II [Cryptophyta sp. CCMP2293]